MAIGCGGKCAKYLLFVFNFIFFLCGAGLLAIGLWMRLDPNFNNYVEAVKLNISNPLVNTANIVLIVLGAVIMLVAFLGCAGACCENACFLLMFAVLLGIIIIAQIVAGVLALIFNQQLGAAMKSGMSQQARTGYRADINQGLTKAWAAMQYNLQCCGGDSYLDYKNSQFVNDSRTTTGYAVPLTCCKLKNSDSTQPDPQDTNGCQTEARAESPSANLNSQGCYSKLTDWLKGKAIIIAAVALAVIVIEIIGIVLACCVRRRILESDGKGI